MKRIRESLLTLSCTAILSATSASSFAYGVQSNPFVMPQLEVAKPIVEAPDLVDVDSEEAPSDQEVLDKIVDLPLPTDDDHPNNIPLIDKLSAPIDVPEELEAEILGEDGEPLSREFVFYREIFKRQGMPSDSRLRGQINSRYIYFSESTGRHFFLDFSVEDQYLNQSVIADLKGDLSE